MTALPLALAMLVAAPSADIVTVPRPLGGEWYGIYLSGKKLGWSFNRIAIERRDGADVLVWTWRTMVSAIVDGAEEQRTSTAEKVYEARAGGRLLSFRSGSEEDGGASTVGRCSAGECVVTLRTRRGSEERRIAVRDTAETADAARLVAANRVPIHATELDVTDLTSVTVESRFARASSVEVEGVRVKVGIVESRAGRSWNLTTVAEDGRILEMRAGGIVLKAEPERVAVQLHDKKVDLNQATEIPLPRPLPRSVPSIVRYRVRGIPPAYASGARQQVLEDGQQVVVTVRAVVPLAMDPAHDASRYKVAPGLESLLSPTTRIDCDHPDILRVARQITREDEGVYATARRLNHWVFDRFEPVAGATPARASDILTTFQGDATGYSTLFLALARAAGVPARAVKGLVYQERAGARFLRWSAWVEVLSGEEWIAMDPMLDQPVADATHIALEHGELNDTTGLFGAVEVIAADPVN